MKFKEAIDKLSEITRVRVSQASIAEVLGVTRQRVSAMQQNEIKDFQLRKLEDYFGVKINQDVYEMSIERNSCTPIPVLENVEAGMGAGVFVDDEKCLAQYPVGNTILKALSANKEQCQIIFGRGNSMSPTIEGGDALLVDKSKKDIADGRIYIVRYDGQLQAKRLQKIPPKKIKVISDNSQYDSFEMDFSKELDFDFEVIGEVLWSGRVMR